MALIRNYVRTRRKRYRVHREVDCEFAIFVRNDETYLQLDTGGSSERKFPGKTSQTIQLDHDSALKLITLLEQTFNETDH
jgi:hypothetical protein